MPISSSRCRPQWGHHGAVQYPTRPSVQSGEHPPHRLVGCSGRVRCHQERSCPRSVTGHDLLVVLGGRGHQGNPNWPRWYHQVHAYLYQMKPQIGGVSSPFLLEKQSILAQTTSDMSAAQGININFPWKFIKTSSRLSNICDIWWTPVYVHQEEITWLLVEGFIMEVYHSEWLANLLLVLNRSGWCASTILA